MGIRVTHHPAIPDPTEDNLVDAVKAIKESVEIGRKDKRGDPLDSWVTPRDLIDSGLAVIDVSTINAGGVGPGLGSDPITGPPPPGGPFLVPPGDDIPDLPGRPTNVRTQSLWDSIMVKWDWPTGETNVDWKGAVIWVSTTNVFSAGTLAGFSTSNFYIDHNVGLVGPDPLGGYQPGRRYYWVAWFGREDDDSAANQWTPVTGISNQSDWSPYHYNDGVRGTTAQDPEYVLALLQGQITESHIWASLNTRINLIDRDSDWTLYTEPVQDRILAATKDAEDGVYAAIAQYAGTNIHEQDGETVLRGEYNLRIDLNGYIVGFGLSALANLNEESPAYGATSTFLVKADSFAIAFPDHETDPDIPDNAIIPFVVGTVGGVPTVGIDGQLVVDGTITASALLAETIGAREINANEVWADMVSANRVISSTFATAPKPKTRVEINGAGTENEIFPFWYGWGETSRITRTDISAPYLWMDSEGSMALAGDLYVTGTGRFWLGSNSTGEYRLEIGGYDDNIMFWAGRSEGYRSIDPNMDDWIFYIDKFGEAKFRGVVEAAYVSGEFTQVVPINFYSGVVTSTHFGEKPTFSRDYDLIGEWVLPASPFNNPDVDLKPGHLPFLQIQAELTGDGENAGTLAIEWDSGNGIWVVLAASAYNIADYGGYHQIFASAPDRIFSACRFRLWAAGRQSNAPTVGSVVGLLMGIR